MAGSDIVRKMLKARGVTAKELSVKMDCPYQSLRNKLYRDSFPFKEIESIAALLNCDIAAYQKDSGERI